MIPGSTTITGIKNFTKAANDCNASQPALSKAIKALEQELGAPLFHREGKQVLLSDFGRSMLPHLTKIAEEAEITQNLAENFRLLNKVPVRLGVMSTVGHLRLSRFLAQFDKRHDGLDLSVIEDSPLELRDKEQVASLGAEFRVGEWFQRIPGDLRGLAGERIEYLQRCAGRFQQDSPLDSIRALVRTVCEHAAEGRGCLMINSLVELAPHDQFVPRRTVVGRCRLHQLGIGSHDSTVAACTTARSRPSQPPR